MWDCIDLEAKLITVKRNYCDKSKQVRETTKGRNIRRVPINQQLCELVMENQQSDCTSFAFKGVNFRHASLQLKKIAIQAGVTPIRFHDLRHTFASNFTMSGGLIYDLQRILGNHSITQLERYSHLKPGYLAGKTEILSYGKKEISGNVIQLFKK